MRRKIVSASIAFFVSAGFALAIQPTFPVDGNGVPFWLPLRIADGSNQNLLAKIDDQGRLHVFLGTSTLGAVFAKQDGYWEVNVGSNTFFVSPGTGTIWNVSGSTTNLGDVLPVSSGSVISVMVTTGTNVLIADQANDVRGTLIKNNGIKSVFIQLLFPGTTTNGMPIDPGGSYSPDLPLVYNGKIWAIADPVDSSKVDVRVHKVFKQ